MKVGDKTFTPTSAEGCTPVPDQGMPTEGTASACTTLKFTIPTGTFPEGDYKVVVENPSPANCNSMETVTLHVAPPPAITSIMPIGVCDTQGDQTVALTGTGFLQVGMNLPTVTIGNMPFKATMASGCTKVMGMFTEGDVEECTGLTVVVPKGTFKSGSYPVTVQNPDPAGCKTDGMIMLTVEDPPVVTSVVPATMCAGGGNFKIAGSGFLQGATVSLQAMGKPTLKSDMTTVNATGTEIDAHVDGPGNPGDVYDLVVDNGDGCTDIPPHQKVTITAGPIAFFADPDVVYNGINTRVTVYATTIMAPLPANAVEIVPTGQAAPITDLTFAPSPGHPNRIQAIVPVGQAAGVYDLILNDATGCPTKLTAAITVTSTLDVTLKAVVPTFGYTGTETDVTIQRDTAAPAPGDKPFVATPRVFLNPSNPQPNDVAIQLQSVSFTSADQLTAIVPRNQPAHLYDLVVVNPDGTVGLLSNAFTVQSVAPATISTVTPSSIVDATGQVVTVAGKDFSASKISLTCKDAMGNAVPAPMVAQGAITCDAQQNCTQKATIDGSALPVGSICVLRITNGDGSFFDYSAIGVTNASLNLPGTHAGSSLNVGRRALVAASGNATAAARYIYAVGGDGGMAMANAPFNSVEVAPVDPFGNFGAWVTQKPTLTTPRAFSGGVSVGRYIYVLGGTDGTNALNTGERARILDPTEVPAERGRVSHLPDSDGQRQVGRRGAPRHGGREHDEVHGRRERGARRREGGPARQHRQLVHAAGHGQGPQGPGGRRGARSGRPEQALRLRPHGPGRGRRGARQLRVPERHGAGERPPDRRHLDDRSAAVRHGPLAAQRVGRGHHGVLHDRGAQHVRLHRRRRAREWHADWQGGGRARARGRRSRRHGRHAQGLLVHGRGLRRLRRERPALRLRRRGRRALERRQERAARRASAHPEQQLLELGGHHPRRRALPHGQHRAERVHLPDWRPDGRQRREQDHRSGDLVKRSKTMSRIASSLAALLAVASLAGAASAADPAAPGPAAPAPDSAKPADAPKSDRGAFVAAGKIGGIAPFDGLGPFVIGGLEVGYIAPWLNRSLALYVDVSYTVPQKTGTGSNDPRVDNNGAYNWTLTQKELTVLPHLVYRLTKLGRFVPYIGVGPRLYFLESITEGTVGSQTILQTKERSMKVGLGVPLGGEFKIGPGAILAEFLFEYGPLDHSLTGNSNTAGGSLQVGYRLML